MASQKKIIVLQIETATTNCSVAIAQNGKTIAVKEQCNGFSHAENLHVFIQALLEECGLNFSALSAVAVSKGPGSYTGLRIGVSAAKGFCYALSIPLIAIETLQAFAQQVTVNQGYIIPMIDARRMEAYTAVFDFSHHKIRQTKADIFTPELYGNYLEKDTVYFIGNAVAKAQTIIHHEHAVFIAEKLPSAKDMTGIAYEKYQKNDFVDVAYFEPYYLKDFVATPSKK
jgi:tRNA threonylcarbamoyladenosine biosynthesis protein TsaB